MLGTILIIFGGCTAFALAWAVYETTIAVPDEWDERRMEFERDMLARNPFVSDDAERLFNRTIDAHCELCSVEKEICCRCGVTVGDGSDLSDAVQAAVYDGRGWPAVMRRLSKECPGKGSDA